MHDQSNVESVEAEMILLSILEFKEAQSAVCAGGSDATYFEEGCAEVSGCDRNATQAVFGEYAAGFVLLDYFLPAVPGVVLESSGADGLMWPNRFSGVPDWILEGPGPAVAGLSPFEPEG